MSEKIPKGWKWVKLGEVAEVVGGFAFKSQHFGKHGTPVVKIKDIKPPYIDVEELEKVDTSFYNDKNLKKYYIEKDDFVLAMTGATIGKIGILKRDLKLLINQRVAKIAPKDMINKAFIYYSINNNTFQQFIQNNIDSNSAQENISSQSIGRFPILLPPLPEQKAIAEVLSSIDDKIDLLHRQNKTLEEMAMTLFRQWFIEPTKNGLPEGWEEGKLGDILSIIESGSRPKGGIDPNLKDGIPSIGAENINGLGNYDYSKTKYISKEFYNSMKRGRIQDYDVLIYKDGAYIGKKAMFGKGYPFEKATINEHVFILRGNNKVNQFFLYFLLNQQDLEQLNSNSVQPGLTQEAMKSFEIIIPSFTLISSFGELTKTLVDKIFSNSKQIRTLEKLRDTLLPKLMSGELRIKL